MADAAQQYATEADIIQGIMAKFQESLKSSKITFKILGTEYQTAVASFSMSETMSSCFQGTLTLVSDKEIPLNVEERNVIKKTGLLKVKSASGTRAFHGMINQFRMTEKIGNFYTYHVSLVPALWFASCNRNCRVFHDKTAIEITGEILDKYGLVKSKHYEFRLNEEDYEKRQYCTQYGESDLQVLSRILQEEGIYFYFEHSEDNHLLIFADDNMAFEPLETPGPLGGIQYKADSGQEASWETISDFGLNHGVTPGKVTQTGHNFTWQSQNMEALNIESDKKELYDEYEVYDYPASYGTYELGKKRTEHRQQCIKVHETSCGGTSNCPVMSPGFTFDLKGHDFKTLDKKYIITSVAHGGKQAHVLAEYSGMGGDFKYSNTFSVIPYETTYRNSEVIKKPYIRGMQTATVIGPEGSEINTDPFGRVQVVFHWDRLGKKNDKLSDESKCWLRPAQLWAGRSWGTLFTPRVGDEVLVDFINGDPDWPIIVGCLFNMDNQPLNTMPDNKTRSTIRTWSSPADKSNPEKFNELSFEDQTGSEQIYLRGEKDWNILIQNDKAQNIGHDETLEVKNDRTKTIEGNQSETIKKNKTTQVTGNHEETIDSNMKVIVKGSKDETVQSNESQTIEGTKTTSVTGQMDTSCKSSMTEQVSQSKQIDVGTTYTLSANSSIRIACGGSTIELSPGGIRISGANIALSGKTTTN